MKCVILSLLKKEAFNRYYATAIKVTRSEPLSDILRALNVIHEKSESDLTIDDLIIGLGTCYPQKKSEGLIQIVESWAGTEYSHELLTTYLEEEYKKSSCYDIALTALEYSEGRGNYDKVLAAVERLDTEPVQQDYEFAPDSIRELKEVKISRGGYRWRLKTLNRLLGYLPRGSFGFLFARPDCLAKDTLVMRWNGKNEKVQNLKAGDFVMGPDSKPRRVLATTHGHAQMYRIRWPWGEYFDCNANHILHLRKYDGTVLNIRVEDYLKTSGKIKHDYKQTKVGIEFPEIPLKCDPYVLGLWLGDGTSSSPEFTNMDSEVIEYLNNWAVQNGQVCVVSDTPSRAKNIRVNSLSKKHGSNKFLQFLKSARLLNNKHIPEHYLKNSRETRLKLLAGLLDTDGSLLKGGYEITQVRETLANEILWLARSVGFHAVKKNKIVNGTTYYRLNIYGPGLEDIPVKIPRKKYIPKTTKRNGLAFGFTIEKLQHGEYYGIYVDTDNLYVLSDFTVVHNTGKTTFLASEITYMARQMEEEESVLWIANEEPVENVKVRTLQAVFGKTEAEIFSEEDRYQAAYDKHYGGRLKISGDPMLNHRKAIEDAITRFNVKILVLDQLDKVGGFKQDDRQDLTLGTIYKWARDTATKMDVAVIGVTQAGASAEGKKYLRMTDVMNSNTAKQAEADYIIGIGKDTENEGIRYIHTPKDKLPLSEGKDPASRHGFAEVAIYPDIARFGDLDYASP